MPAATTLPVLLHAVGDGPGAPSIWPRHGRHNRRGVPTQHLHPSDLALLKDVSEVCVPCQTYAHLPRRPRFSLPNRPLTLNRVVAMDVFQIAPDLPKVLDISCVDTDYGQGRFVPSMHGPVIFAILYIAWLSIWGSMETIIFDRGTENKNDAVINGVTSMGIHWRAAPTEAPWGIGRNERHHGPIRAAFLKIRMETPDIAPDMALAMAYKARNDAPRAHGFSPTTVVTGEPPRLLIGDNAHADPAVASRARAMQTARATMESYTAADRLRNALAHPGTNVAYVQVGQSVLFHRRLNGWLRGTVHSLDGKTVYVRRNGTLFSSHESRTKPYVTRTRQPQDAHRVSASTRPQAPIRTHTPAPPEATTLPPAARAYAVHHPDINSPAHPRWDAAMRTEITTFDAMDCKKAIHASDVPAGKQIFNYIWRVTSKANRGNGKPDERARFCLAGNQDWHKKTNVATSPVTPQRAIRAIVAASVVLNLKLHTEDFLRAYLQSNELKEPIYVRAPPEAGLPDGYVWAFYRSLYGKDDAGRHFDFSVQCRFLTIPGVRLSAAFDAVYISPLHGALSTYVDDSLTAGDNCFTKDIKTIMSQYKTHRPDHDTIQFAGITVQTSPDGVECDAGAYNDTLRPIDVPPRNNDAVPDPKELLSLAAKLLWVGRVGRPDVMTNATHLSNLKNPTAVDAKRANDTLAIITWRPVALAFPKLNLATLRLAVFADYSGSTLSAVDKRQVGYIIILTDASHRFAPLHWASHRPYRVCRGATAGELLALADAVAACYDIRTLLQELLARPIPLDAYTDSATVYNLVTSFQDPADMSGKNDLLALRRALLSGDLSEINNITGEHNLADSLSKPTWSNPKSNTALTTALTSGILNPPVTAHTTTDGYRNSPRPDINMA
ncbi:hypothetical protein I4F81_012208 [Pyropia yezoensis]|uniref:Uncharacterized protein n=1 Tax=Pyropia yezoensis TaxID=2788 RepID=A0ACC3CJ26_PYRYE|nr:hypothetical protein I4F81_012208 [Neopyropia yezoensis]